MTIDTMTPLFGTGAAVFAGGSDYLTVPAAASGPLDFGAGDFTIEFSFMLALGVNPAIKSFGLMGSVAAAWDIGLATGTGTGPWSCPINFGTTISSVNYNVGGSVSVNTGIWYSVAVSRVGTEIYLFFNGVQIGAAVTVPAAAITTPNPLPIGNAAAYGSSGFTEIDELRITKGVGRYTANYTPAIIPFGTTIAYDPFSLYYPGRGQYWLFFGPQAFVLTINGTGTKSWSRYIFPQTITDWTLNAGILYLRTANNLVWKLDAGVVGVDDFNAVVAAPTPFNGVIQWPYLDLSSLGLQKMLVGIDIVGTGNCSVQIAFNQNDSIHV